MKIIRELGRKENIYIISAEKGNGSVIIKRRDYDGKMSELVQSGPYTQLESDPTDLYFTNSKNVCDKLRRQKKLTDDEYRIILPNHPRISK